MSFLVFLDPEDGPQNATLVVVVVVINSLKIPKAFVSQYAAERSDKVSLCSAAY